LNRVCHSAARLAGIKKRVSMHTFRHSFATHLLDQGVDIRVIQVLLGHQDIRFTARYSRVATHILHETTSPLDILPTWVLFTCAGVITPVSLVVSRVTDEALSPS